MKRLGTVLVTVATLVTAGCGTSASAGQGADSGSPVRGGTLKFAISGDPLCLDGHAISSGLNQYLGRIAYDTVTTLDREGNPAPYLADSWTVSPDGTTYTFKLKSGVTFSDGTAWDAEAFKLNLEHMRDPKTKSPLAAAYIAPYKDSKVIDARTLEVHLSSAYTPFTYVLAQSWLGVLSPKAIKESPKTLCDKPIASGPFVVESYKRGQSISYVRRAGYNWAPAWLKHQGEAYLDRIEVTIVPEPVVRFNALTSGQYDITDLVPAQNAKAVEANKNLTFENLTRTGHPNAIWFNTGRAPLNDLAVRRAVVAAVDVAAVAKSVGFGYFPVKDNYLASNSKYYDKTTEGILKYDAGLANQLLDKAGWTGRDGQGYRINAVGKRLSLALPTVESATPSPQLVQVQGQLKTVGIELRIEQLPQAQVTDRRYAGDYDLTSGYWHTNTTDVLFIRYHSSEIPGARIGQNASYLKDAKLDAILAEARRTPDGPKAAALYAQAQHRLIELVPALPQWEANAQWAYQKRLHGVAIDTSHPQPVLTGAWLAGK
ncbi:ABC transporter substrate-binding protein [Kribbella sp. NPDC056951]|uniref:ABC transporter substrate-binding protein n=1 Tax=Kribbella sp. NPDC056951 TaxID=3345978 RepID=UPI00363C145A